MTRILFMVAPLTILLVSLNTHASDLLISENKTVAKGNKLLAEGKPSDALEQYDEATAASPKRNEIHLNRGLALARTEQTDQAMQAFTLAAEGQGSAAVRGRAMANLGNTFFQKEDFDAAIEHYKKSLILAPGNKDVAWNLELAQQKKKEKEEQQKEQDENKDQQDQKQDQDKKDQQDQKQDQDKKDQQDKDKKDQQDQKQDQDKKDQQDQEKKEQEQKQQPPQPKTQQEIEQLLNALDEDDDLRKDMARKRAAMVPMGFKDW